MKEKKYLLKLHNNNNMNLEDFTLLELRQNLGRLMKMVRVAGYWRLNKPDIIATVKKHPRLELIEKVGRMPIVQVRELNKKISAMVELKKFRPLSQTPFFRVKNGKVERGIFDIRQPIKKPKKEKKPKTKPKEEKPKKTVQKTITGGTTTAPPPKRKRAKKAKDKKPTKQTKLKFN